MFSGIAGCWLCTINPILPKYFPRQIEVEFEVEVIVIYFKSIGLLKHIKLLMCEFDGVLMVAYGMGPLTPMMSYSFYVQQNPH